MYNKLFTKILDSSIWLESTQTRIVWLTFIAVMDEQGMANFASVGNVAHRARVTLEEAQEALGCLERPDPDSYDPDHEGRRVERVPGGWMVLNADKHRRMVTKAIIQAQTRERVQRHREKKRRSNAGVTPSEAIALAEEREKSTKASLSFVAAPGLAELAPGFSQTCPAKAENALMRSRVGDAFGADPFTDPALTLRAGAFVERYHALYPLHRKGARYAMKPARDYQAAVTLCQTWPDDARLEKLAICFLTTDHKFAAEGSRTLPQFLALASWCDGELAAWEHKQ